ncbi:hypothetical protein I862_07520 [endosymbiont of Acanthamoeba sp. UWC8]|uniref:AHH domain-containing protein n=1 Tax=endosymbiont of Acanthamoeba sp. UWC8 TaxID=86106 RepID=UPI0004D1900D|nr:AHH domain-containing protein [endosymbiont of Acanthamoeba sp. UWC8]AIF82058.1 hypothetical protein I862_07520 [endosymbiont of Acanthamoeba sp. UWC8]
MDLIDLVFDNKYFNELNSGSEPLDWWSNLNLYKKEGIIQCNAPNKYFFEHPTLLYLSTSSGDKQCQLDNWNKSVLSKSSIKFLSDYIYLDEKSGADKVNLLKYNLSQIANYSLQEIENLLGMGGDELAELDLYIISILSSDYSYKINEKTIKYLEQEINESYNYYGRNVISQIVSILINYTLQYAENSSHSIFLSELLNKEDIDISLKDLINLNFSKAIIKSAHKFDKVVYNNLELFLPKVEDKILLLRALAHAAQNGDYIPKGESLVFFEEILLVNKDYTELALDTISIIIESLIDKSANNDDFIKIEQKLIDLVNKDYKLPLSLIDKIIETYTKEQNHFIELLAEILANYKDLPKNLLSKLVVPVLNKILATNDVNTAKHLVFIAKRLSQNHIDLLEETTKYFSKFLSSKEVSLQRLAFDLYEQLSKKRDIDEELANNLLELLPKVNKYSQAKIISILNAAKLNEDQTINLALAAKIFIWKYSDNIEQKLEISKELAKLINLKDYDYLEIFFKQHLITRNKNFIEVADSALEYINNIQEVFFNDHHKEIRNLFKASKADQPDQNTPEIFEFSFGANSNFILNEDEWNDLQDKFEEFAWDVSKQLKLISFTHFSQVLELLAFIGKYNLNESDLASAAGSGFAVSNVYLNLNNIIFKKSLTGRSDLTLPESELKILLTSVTHLLNFDWPLESLLDLLAQTKQENISLLIATLEKLADYKVGINIFDRDGLTAADILVNKEPEEWPLIIQRLIKDNHFFIYKDHNELLKELAINNKDKPTVIELIENKYFENQLSKIEEISNNWLKHKYNIIISNNAAPKPKEADKIYLYSIGDQLHLAKDEQSIYLDNISAEEKGRLNNILSNKHPINDVESNFIFDLADKHNIAKKLSSWSEEDSLIWRQSISKVDDSNIAEVLTVLRQVAYNTIGFYPRSVQLLSVLSLFKSPNGGLAQIATGEGKSLIIAMFATIQVLSGRQVDIITSSPVLAIRDVEEYQDFYEKVGITVDHNIGSTGNNPKICYEADIVYGDPIHFIGDSLRDITTNIKLGRGYDLIIADEVDNIFIDQTNMKVQLSSLMPGFEALKQVLIYMWGGLHLVTPVLQHDEKTGNCLYKQPPIPTNETLLNDLSEEGYKQFQQNFTLIPLNQTCEDYAKTFVTQYTKDHLFNFGEDRESRSVIIPIHLESFVKKHLPAWVKSIINAYYYQEKIDYVTYPKPGMANITVIAPVNSDSGVIQSDLRWSDGLHPFLEIKHGLTIFPESIISTFMSYVGYFANYKGSIYGLTGTLGNDPHHNFLKKVYEVDLVKIPQFINKDLNEFPPIITDNIIQWHQEIIQIMQSKIAGQRAALVILETIAQVETLANHLRESGYDNDQIFLYGTENALEDKKVKDKEKLEPGDIIIATNLAGRGTDLQISSEVIKNGGLHVIMGDLPESSRVQDQGFGRVARNGEPGSAQLVLINHGLLAKCNQDIICSYNYRNHIELSKLKEEELCEIPKIELQGKLFTKYVDLAKHVNSPTGYILKLSNPDNENNPLTGKTLYLSKQQEKIILSISDENKQVTDFDITEMLLELDLKVNKHIRAILAKSNISVLSLNQQDHEVIHFIATYKGFTDHSVIPKRIERMFNKELEDSYTHEQQRIIQNNNEKEKSKIKDKAKEKYLEKLLTDDEFKCLNTNQEITPELLKKVELRKYYLLWQEDRKLYNYQFEIKEITDLWAFWLNKQNQFLNENQVCKISSEEDRKILSNYHEAKEQMLFRNFTDFSEQVLKLHQKNQLMKNPTHLVQKAWHYFGIHNQQQSMRLDNSISDISPRTEDDSLFGWLKDSVSSAFNTAYNAIYNSLLGNYDVKQPLAEAVGFLNQAIRLDSIYSWPAHNAKSFLQLIKDGAIFDLEDAEKANKVKREFYESTGKAIELISNHVIPQLKSQASFLLMQKLATPQDDLIVQLINTIKVYEKIMELQENNIKIVAGSEGDQMIRVKRHVSLASVSQNINATASVMEFLNNTLSIKANSTSIFTNIAQDLNFNSQPVVLSELSELGVVLFEIETFQLEDDSNWFGTVFSAVLGVAQICIGIALMASGGGAFAMLFAKGLVIQGIGDIISSAMSVINGVPIDMGNYLKSKGIGTAINLLTAGLGQLGQSAEIFENLHSIGKIAGADMSAMQFAGIAAATQVGAAALGAVLYNAGKQTFLDKDELEQKIKSEIEHLIAKYISDLQKIIATDLWQNNNHLQRSLISQASEVMKKYHGRFSDTGTRVGVQTLSSVIGVVTSGLGFTKMGETLSMANTAFAGATTLAFNGIKNAEALDHFIDEMNWIVSKLAANNALSSGVMMQNRLIHNFGETISVELMTSLEQQSYIVNQELNYKDCDALNQVVLSDNIQATGINYKTGLVTICNKIAKVFNYDYQSSTKENLKGNLVDLLTGNLYALQKEGMGAAADFLGGQASSLIVNSVYEKIEQGKKKKIEEEKRNKKIADEIRREAEDMKSKSANRINRASGVFVKQPQSAAEPEVYPVKDGDTVDGIAAEYGVSRDDILEANPKLKDKISVDEQGRTKILIKEGENLILPQGASKQTGSKGSSSNQKPNKPANDNTDTKSKFTQPEPDSSNNKAEPRSSSQPTYTCTDGVCFTSGEGSEEYNSATSRRYAEPIGPNVAWHEEYTDAAKKIDGDNISQEDKQKFKKEIYEILKETYESTPKEKELIISELNNEKAKHEKGFISKLFSTKEACAAEAGVLRGGASAISCLKNPTCAAILIAAVTLSKAYNFFSRPFRAEHGSSDPMHGQPQKADVETFPAEEQKPDILFTPDDGGSFDWYVETFPVDDKVNHLPGFSMPEGIDTRKESFPIHDGDIHFILEFTIDGKKFQEHHIISDKNKLTSEHKLWEKAGIDAQSRKNKIYLPTKEEHHPTRSIHLGGHSKIVSEKLADKMDKAINTGEMQGWTQEQYKEALHNIIVEERAKLRSGERALNKHKRYWTEEQK